jgi:predicted metal-dependent peptidase
MGKLKVPIELSEARLAACRVWPEASHVIMSMVPVESPGLAQRAAGSICVDQYWRLYYDPVAFLARSVAQRISVILHEVAHLLGRHHVRAKRYVAPDDRQAWFDWNCACDMAVWSHVAASGMPVAETAVTAEKAGFPENLSVEQYYRLIRDKREQDRQQAEEQAQQEQQEQDEDNQDDTQGDSDDDSQQSGDSDGDDSQETDDGDGAGEPEGSDAGSDQSGDQYESGSEDDQDGAGSQGQPDDGSGDEPGQTDDVDGTGCDSDGGRDGGNHATSQDLQGVEGGSCADGQQREWELPPPDAGDGGDSENTPPVVEQWKQEILINGAAERAAQSGRGTGAGMWRELIERYKEPKLDPRRLLQKALSKQLGNLQAGCGRFTYRRPARRPSLGGTLRPRSFQPVPRILVIIDTSGSMSSAEMRLGVGLVSKCINALRLQDGVHVITGDDCAQWDKQVFNPRHVDLIGGGGTDMACLIEHAASKPQSERPELIVVVTDGETGWPRTRVPMPVVAAITRETHYGNLYPPPAWIDSVKLY